LLWKKRKKKENEGEKEDDGADHKEMSLVGGDLRARKRHHEPSSAITPSQQKHFLLIKETKTLSSIRAPHFSLNQFVDLKKKIDTSQVILYINIIISINLKLANPLWMSNIKQIILIY